ncbi:6-carboxytetrahydropterin synthase [Paenibacillus barcinonensis]|uniref:6-carboxy-5,6,7,8-tetrahydropterin synthase n=1 Tax=Paenibacillus barcinonensis TaxID=198119 RepID=A0A2V4VR22_PAEBA|nr:6-carboxytetrahydropterin synthase [Paenibacillus barcinonensis]PYE48833.1 6-pyruvoyltetrahydropterin/6-carboxytetrahydropterin synthase [Paenibacillus barcinonensis]QKS57741.1 6-carboxytetrahydropterin synthase [Paenibacillus barcinonensis]
MFHLSRRVEFSAAHVYHVPSWSEQQNKEVFGKCSNLHGHGHDYKLDVVVRGKLNPQSGIVVNTTDIKNTVNAMIEEELDGKFLNREHDHFQHHMPTTENMALYIWDRLNEQFDDCELQQIKLYENTELSAEKERHALPRLTRKYHFCASHRLHSPLLSDEENRQLFGKCNNPHGHGHNYVLDVTVQGTPDADTGMIIHLSELDSIVEREVLDRYDHHHLNLDVEDYKDLNPTSEVVAMVIYNLLKPHLPQLYRIGLWETDKNYFEYYGSGA